MKLQDGVHNITATQTDYVGNVSNASSPLSVNISTVAPVKPAVSGVAQSVVNVNGVFTANTSPTFTGTAPANSLVSLSLNQQALGTTTADANGNWIYTVSKPGGLTGPDMAPARCC